MFNKKFLQATAQTIVSAFIIGVSRGAAQSSAAEGNLDAWSIELPHSPPTTGNNVKLQHRVNKNGIP